MWRDSSASFIIEQNFKPKKNELLDQTSRQTNHKRQIRCEKSKINLSANTCWHLILLRFFHCIIRNSKKCVLRIVKLVLNCLSLYFFISALLFMCLRRGRDRRRSSTYDEHRVLLVLFIVTQCLFSIFFLFYFESRSYYRGFIANKRLFPFLNHRGKVERKSSLSCSNFYCVLFSFKHFQIEMKSDQTEKKNIYFSIQKNVLQKK